MVRTCVQTPSSEDWSSTLFTCIVSRDAVEVFRVEFDRTLEVGRQADGDPPPYCLVKQGQVWRLICVPLGQVEFSRRQFIVEHLVEGQMKITNLGTVRPLVLPDGTELRGGHSLEFGPSLSFRVDRCEFLITNAPPPPQEQSDPGSVTNWLRQVQQGDDSTALRGLWDRYFQKLAVMAQLSLSRGSLRMVDGEDVALDVFHRLCRGFAQGRFDRLGNRDDLWRMLVSFTKQKVVDEVRHHGALKRGGASVRGDSAFGDPNEGFGLDNCLGRDPTPDDLAGVAEQFALLLEKLSDEESRQIVRLRLEGYGNQEIADRLEIGLNVVDRKLAVARELLLKISR